MENNNQDFFQQFSDQLRLQQTSSFSNLSINDSIWSTNKKERRNFDVRVGAERSNNNNNSSFSNTSSSDLGVKQSFGSEINGFNTGWKITNDLNGGFNKGAYLKPGNTTPTGYNNNSHNFSGFSKNFNTNSKVNEKGRKNEVSEGKTGKKNNSNSVNNNGNSKSGVDKRFKTLPPSESLPRGEIIGGYIFVCNNDTMQENLQRQLFGLPPRYRDSVRAITPGLPLFLYNYSDHQLHGIFEASSFGGANIDPTAWEDKKSAGESRFPAQVRVVTRKICNPLEEDSFRPILHHYDGPKFRLELSVPEALALLDVFAES